MTQAETAKDLAKPGDTVRTFEDGSVVITKVVSSGAEKKALYAAIAKSQAACKGVEKGSENKHHRYKYASAEDMIDGATKAMDPNGLSLICTEAVPDDEKNPRMMTVRYLLTHSDGGDLALGPYSLTVHPDKGRPMDKAITTCLTYLQAYCIRGILNVPRVEEGTERDAIDDQLIQGYKNAENELLRKVRTAHDALWKSSQKFFDVAGIERDRTKDGAALFKKWIAFMANPDKPWPDNVNEQFVAIEVAKAKLAEWKREHKEESEDAAHVCGEFASFITPKAEGEVSF